MLFLNTQTGEYPRHIGDLEILGWKQGEPLPENWVEVDYAESLPNVGENELYYEIEPVLENGRYKQTFAIRPMTEDEIARRNAPKTAKAKLQALGFSDAEIRVITAGLIL